MGSACTTPEMKEQAAMNRKIDRQIRKDENDQLGDQKLLLLGTGECGKSTILKQMHILHKEGFSQADREAMKEIVFSNIIVGMGAIIKARVLFRYDVGSEDTESETRLILALIDSGKDILPFSPQVFSALKRLWASKSIKQTFERRSEFQLGDSISYFMDDLERIYDGKYLPTPADVLHIRVPTTGVVQVAFPIKGCTFRVFDVGGQRSERRKWIHLFADVNALIYISAISEYDQKLSEDPTTNRFNESIDLFRAVITSNWFNKSSVILFLNKRDLYEEKLKHVPITVLFDDYKGPNTYADTIEFIREMFNKINNSPKTKKIYTHETCATDTTQVQLVIDSVIDTVIGKNLRGTGMD